MAFLPVCVRWERIEACSTGELLWQESLTVHLPLI